MEETGASDIGDGAAHLLPGVDNIDPKGVHCIPPEKTVHRGYSGQANLTPWGSTTAANKQPPSSLLKPDTHSKANALTVGPVS